MFKLKKVELLGFKSFADRTRLEFTDGIAAIVGPNGCGKSNLADAISWVLGEQSARLLRGERMADVIFNGTGTRPPTGMAEASLTLMDPEYEQAGAEEPEEAASLFPDSESSTLAADAGTSSGHGNSPAFGARRPATQHRAGEITVTRRLFRSGESEYLIHGETCRLRDIQDLFMGTGLGPESYAIIEQGRIGQILSSKPSDRRAIIEEAAGVSKFQTRKRLAEAKLESSRQNLARITDILEEVSKQVNSLKRQASKARRYRELHEELRGRQRLVLAARFMALEAECQRLGQHLAGVQAEHVEAARRLEQLEREYRDATRRHEELEARLTQLREQIARGNVERERLQSRLEQVRHQIANLEARAVEAAQESEQLQAQIALREEEVQERARQAEQVRGDWAAAQESAAGLLARQEQLALQVGLAEQEAETRRQEVLVAVSRAADLRNQLVQAEEMGLALERQLARMATEYANAEKEHEHLSSEVERFQSEQQREQIVLQELAQSVSQISAGLEQARAEEAARREEMENLRQELSAASARKQALEETLARHAYTTESVRRLLSSDIPINGRHFRPLGLLADFVEVAPGYEEAVEEFLRHELDCVVVEQPEEARSGIALLQSEGAGRSTFFVTQFPSNGHSNGPRDSAVRSEPGVVAAVRDLVRFESRLGLNGDPALPALENAYLVQDSSTAERLVAAYPQCHFLTPGGEHYQYRLVSGGRGSSAGPLALRREFRALERRTVDLASNLRTAEEALADVAARGAGLEKEWRRQTFAKLEAEKKVVVAEEKMRQLREALERTTERRRLVQDEAAGLQRERESVLEQEANLRTQLEAAAAERVRRDEAITQVAARLRDQRAQLDKLAPELVAAQARSSTLEERTRAIEAENARLRNQTDELQTRLARLAAQLAAWRDEQQQLAEEEKKIHAPIQELAAAQREAQALMENQERESQALRLRRDGFVPRVEAARAEVAARRESRSEVEIALARAESDRAHHTQQCRENLNVEPDALLAELTPEQVLSGEALEAAEAQLREIKTRIENLGPVNMMALEELQEAEDRFTFLETQRQDLLASIDDTTQAIREIDQVSRQQFLEAFLAINGCFAETFRTLFGGGLGEMRLTDESDPDSGVDIVAQPPGKRLQNVLLLSGGEKALAALALLIAIFRYTPSPFCVLDEVDAPLDESNIDRFTRLIQQMSRHTQFILITHNKRTMEMAQVMYGVTMEEPGVSKLVSVKFDKVEREPVPVLA